MTKHIVKLYIGDWTDDGHGKCQDFYIISNYPIEAVQQAYKDTCKKIGLQLHSGEDYTGLEPNSKVYGSWRYIATEYEDSELSEDVLEILVQHGCTLHGEPLALGTERAVGPEDMYELFMWFVTYSMPTDFVYEKLEAEAINDNLYIQIGYGCF